MRIRRLMGNLQFLLLHAPSIFRYYRDTVLNSSLLVVFAATPTFLTRLGVVGSTWSQSLQDACTVAPVIVLALLATMAIVALLRRRLSAQELVQERLLLDAYYSQKSYDLVARHFCFNPTPTHIREVSGLKDAYTEPPTAVEISAKVIGRDASRSLDVRLPSRYEILSIDGGNRQPLYVYEAAFSMDPTLAPGERLSFVATYHAEGVEQDAFNGGTQFVWGVFYETHELVITIHAPPGFRISFMRHFVYDTGGQRFAREVARLPSPRSLGDGIGLQWRIVLPRKYLRYGLEYRIERFAS